MIPEILSDAVMCIMSLTASYMGRENDGLCIALFIFAVFAGADIGVRI